jgi:hypothetical protein
MLFWGHFTLIIQVCARVSVQKSPKFREKAGKRPNGVFISGSTSGLIFLLG